MFALARLGGYTLIGFGVQQNPDEAARMLERSAELGGVTYEYSRLAQDYVAGRNGLPRDLGKAVECYYHAAIYCTSNVEAHFTELEKLGAPNVPLYRAMAMVHDANQQVWVSSARVKREVPVLEELGANNAAAQYELGTIYIDDDWINHDYAKALEHLNRARGLGEDRANFSLARMRLMGRGLPRDVDGAMSDLALMAADGSADAATYLGTLYYWGAVGAPKIPKDPRKAYDYTRQGAERGSVLAMINLAHCYEESIGVPRDYLVAAKLYWIAYRRGYLRGGEWAIRMSHFIDIP
jgi:TPR repeat protein